MIKAWSENQNLIKEYFTKKENYQSETKEEKEEKKEKELREVATILGVGIGIFVFLFILSTLLFIWGLYVLIVYWNRIPDWAKIIGIISLFFFPLLTVILVYGLRDQVHSNHIHNTNHNTNKKK